MKKKPKLTPGAALVANRWRKKDARKHQSESISNWWAQFTSEERKAILRERAAKRAEKKNANAQKGI